jgi:hypothetical protein
MTVPGTYAPIPQENVDPTLWAALNPLPTLLAGGPSAPVAMTGFNDPARYGLDVLNSGVGTGGARLRGALAGGLRVRDATVEIDGGLSITNVNGGGLNVSGVSNLEATNVSTLHATGAATFDGNVTIGDSPVDALAVNATPTFNTGVLFSPATSAIVPGVTSFSFRNHAQTADNLLITDAGAVTVRNGLTVSAGDTTVTTLTASSTVQGTRLISTIATGTAPLTVTSTTKITNLNADLLDDHDASFFLDTSNAGQTKSGALTVSGDLTAGTRLLVGGTPLLLADGPNSRVIVGSGTALTGATNDRFSVVGGTLHVSTPSTTVALSLRFGIGGTGFNLGPSAASNPDLIFHDGVAERFRVGSSAATYQSKTTGDSNVTGHLDVGSATMPASGSIRLPATGNIIIRGSGTNDRNLGSINGSDVASLSDPGCATTLYGTSVALNSSGFDLVKVSGGANLGLYNVTPVARQNVGGSRSGATVTVLRDLLAVLNNLGAINDLTTA